MLVRELLEDVGKNDYHPESFYASTVAEFVQDEGVAKWKDIYAYVDLMLGDSFTGSDKANVPSRNIPRWKIIVNNLHLHRTLEGGRFGDIVRIKGGFATRQAADEQGIPILADNKDKPRNPGKRAPQQIKRLMGTIVSTAYNNLGRPKLKDVSGTRQQIENMIKNDPWLPEPELIKKAEEIISTNR